MADLFHLPERCLIKVSGDEAESFLQNLVTQDVAGLAPGRLIYSCLLTPQGRFLHDFFIHNEAGAFFLECETQRREDLLRRLKIFKLRSKVVIEDCSAEFAVYAAISRIDFPLPLRERLGEGSNLSMLCASGAYPSSQPSPARGEGVYRIFKDPRLETLGYRYYFPVGEKIEAASASAYKDRRIHLGVPEGSIDMKPEFDTLADMNLDRLNAVSWTKGCFVGQEVAARMENRGLVKKRLVIISGNNLIPGEALSQNDVAVGEVRSVNAAGNEGLALLKLAALEEGAGQITRPDKSIITARLPQWLEIQ
jgi:folate-binding protein YgfZ